MAKKDRVTFALKVCDGQPNYGSITVSAGYESDVLPGEDFDAAMDRVSGEVMAKLLKLRKRAKKKVNA